MCLVVAGMVLMAAAGGMQAYGQYEAGSAQDKYYKYLATQNELEAEAVLKTAEHQVTIAQNEAAQRTKELKGEAAKVEGAQKAAMGAMGLSGVSAEDIIKDTFNKARFDELNIRYNADIQSWLARKEARERAWALRNQAGLFKFAGQQAKTAARINMTTTLLGTASSLFLAGAKIPGSSSGTSNIYTGSDFGGFTPSSKLKGFNWSPSGLY